MRQQLGQPHLVYKPIAAFLFPDLFAIELVQWAHLADPTP